jgi:hypothetical protein
VPLYCRRTCAVVNVAPNVAPQAIFVIVGNLIVRELTHFCMKCVRLERRQTGLAGCGLPLCCGGTCAVVDGAPDLAPQAIFGVVGMQLFRELVRFRMKSARPELRRVLSFDIALVRALYSIQRIS